MVSFYYLWCILCRTDPQPGGGGGGGGTPSLRVSRYAPRFCPQFSASGRSFCPPKFDHVYHFIQILLGPISKPPNFQHVDDILAPKIDQIYNFIQILLGPILNFEPRTPTDFYPECPPGSSANWFWSSMNPYQLHTNPYSGLLLWRHSQVQQLKWSIDFVNKWLFFNGVQKILFGSSPFPAGMGQILQSLWSSVELLHSYNLQQSLGTVQCDHAPFILFILLPFF